MAHAPKPGIDRRQHVIDAAKTVLRIRILDETHDIAPNNVPFNVKNRVRKQCDGLPLSAFWNGEPAIDMDSLKVLWWVARILDGEKALTVQQVINEWPDDLGPDDLDITELNADDPSGDGDEEIDDSPES